MRYTSISVDVDINDVTDSMSAKELTAFAAELLDNGYVPDTWFKVGERNLPDYDLSDAAVLLGVITELRKRGYTVEPGGV